MLPCERLVPLETSGWAKQKVDCNRLRSSLGEKIRRSASERGYCGETEVSDDGVIKEGKIVEGTLNDLRDPLYDETPSSVQPSILPKHDDVTIGRLSQRQKMLRNSGLPADIQALQLDLFERVELQIQRSDRTPGRQPLFDADPVIDVHYDS